MIMQSIIIGIGISELLTNFSSALKKYRLKKIGLITPMLTVMLFLALLQMFWETWSLQGEVTWTFPALVLMVAGPIIVHMMAHVLYPNADDEKPPTEYYLSKSSLFWSLGVVAVITSVLFRPLGLGKELFIIDNFTNAPLLIGFIVLIFNKNIWLHRVAAVVFTVLILADTIFINYQIN